MRLGKSVSAAATGAALSATIFMGVDLFHNTQYAAADQNVESAREHLASVQTPSEIFREVDHAVGPSVVNIQVTKTVEHEASQVPPEMQRFFHEFGGGMNVPPGAFGNGGQHMREVGTGSGVIMDVSDGYGYILTNNHVAGGASQMVVTLSDGRIIKDAQLVGADPRTDLAVVKIKADHLIPARWGDSTELEAGDEILAFGSPFGYVGSMTHGIVSALHRQAGILGASGFENFIQVDAPINPGNSGGPLVDLKGDVVGINTAIATVSGGFQGIGFAIPSEQARPIYEQLKSQGKIVRGWLGAEIQNVSQNADVASSEGYPANTGVLIHGVLKGGPASGSLLPGDIVTTFNGKTVTNVDEFRIAVAINKPGSEATLGLFRDSKNQDVRVKIGEQPAPGQEVAQVSSDQNIQSDGLGLQLGNLDDQSARQHGVNDKSGAIVIGVAPNSPAAMAGIREGDVITHVNASRIENAQQAADALAKADPKSGVRLQIDNSQGSEFVFVKPDLG
jgi:serine protease Do